MTAQHPSLHRLLSVAERGHAWARVERVSHSRQLRRRACVAMAAPERGFFSDYYAEQASEPWWGAVPPEDEYSRQPTGDLMTPPLGFCGPMNFDPLKQAPQMIADHRVEWPATWQDYPAYLVERNETLASIHLQRDREERWNVLHLPPGLSCSDTESSPGSPVSAPTFFEPEPKGPPRTDYGQGAPQPFATQDGFMTIKTEPPVQAAPPVPPVPPPQPVNPAPQKETVRPPEKLGRPAAELVHPQKKRRRLSAAEAQVANRRSGRAPMPLVRPDFAQFTESASDEEETEKLDEEISAELTTDTDGETTADSADENDSLAASLPAASATSSPAAQESKTSAGIVDLDAFPPDVKRCLIASQTRMLEWSEAAIILRYHVQIQRQKQLGPKLPIRPLCLVGGTDGSQPGGIYVEMPKIPRPRHRCKSAKARAKLTSEERAQIAREILPGETLAARTHCSPWSAHEPTKRIGCACGVPDRWRNSGGSKGSSDLPKEAKQPTVRRRYVSYRSQQRYAAAAVSAKLCCC